MNEWYSDWLSNRGDVATSLADTLEQAIRSGRLSPGAQLPTHRDLSKRLVQEFHGHHELALATLHVHLDDNNCMEMTALRGDASEVKHFADHIIAERGVRYGRVVMIPTVPAKKPRARKHRHHHD